MTGEAIKRACVIGYPIRHSRSPLIHGHWLETNGLAGSYDRVEVAPEEIGDFITGLAERGYVGCNVTVPHKQAVFDLVTRRDGAADAIGAVNTVWLEDGVLHAANTDVSGFLDNLDATLPGWDGAARRAVVLGAGGAARGIVYGLLRRGVTEIAVVNRTLAHARDLAAAMGPAVSAHGWERLPGLLEGADLFVNTTSLGMSGQPPLAVDLSPLPVQATVVDIVYVPLETDLLRQARARGNAVVDGLGMLLHQAVPGFERWFGVRPRVTEDLRRLLVADIEGRAG